MANNYEKYNTRNNKIIANFESELQTIRVGRANPSILDRIMVDYYGALTPINQLASVSVPEPKTLLISPWDISALKVIEKAISVSDLGVNPNNDGKCIRLSFPSLTEERRKELAKDVRKYAEETKIAVRNVRRDAIEDFKALKKSSEITEDDLKDNEKEIQTITDNCIKKITEISEKKEKELLSV
ncbi:MAG: ribosome recycling factor [Clostridia bacterium]